MFIIMSYKDEKCTNYSQCLYVGMYVCSVTRFR